METSSPIINSKKKYSFSIGCRSVPIRRTLYVGVVGEERVWWGMGREGVEGQRCE
jgi:hypothetical protein